VTDQKIEVGTIVRHPKRPAWGPGKTLLVGGGGQVTVYFRDIEEIKAGDAVKTLSTAVVGLDIAKNQTDSMLDSLPPFTKGRFDGVKKPRLSLDHAVEKFIDLNPGGFEDPAYVATTRSQVTDAHQMWVDGVGDLQGTELLDDGRIDEARKRVLKVGAKAGLLTPDEKGGLEEALADDRTAGVFLRALFDVVGEVGPEQATYQRLIDSVTGRLDTAGGARAAMWPVLTLFPFIACPGHHMQLRPFPVQRCASRLNFDIRYTTGLNWWTYDRLLQMATILLARLESLGARDFIDVHWFIKVIAKV
jgi:hypothetical protein